ncbi:cuticle protein 6-like [Culicoides brevitarsis]|uniref:cuticle protein 6-like n=1 Tax=Culicoides brevitarsis TaxID=469753 RepID=UPI00307C39D5
MKTFIAFFVSCIAFANAAQFVYSPLVLSNPYAVAYPYLTSPLIAPPTTVVLKHHTPEHTAEQEKEKNDEKEKPLQPPVVSLPYPLLPRVVLVSTTAPLTVPGIQSQYHAQDELGQYRYGYNSPLVAKDETKTIDGVTRGSYSYIDANGQYQTAAYVADALGFRIAATNIPKQVEPAYIPDAPEVAEAKAKLFALQKEAAEKAAASPAE